MTALLPGTYSTSNASNPAGDTVSSVFGVFFRDANPSTAVGIAITSMTGGGTWQYSMTAGTSWTNIPAVSISSALLLTNTDWIRFVPKTTGAGTATLVAYAWDGSVGTHGNTSNLMTQGIGGPSAFSATTLTAVCVVNTAPVLTTVNVTLAAVNENAASAVRSPPPRCFPRPPTPMPMDQATVPSGIAVTANAGPGTWQWLNGTTWTALPSVPANSAFLLPSAAQVRFKPADNLASNTPGSATLTYLAWDQTAGAADTTFALNNQGGTSAFSTIAATAAMTVNFVKQAPSWSAGVSAAFTPVLGLSASNSSPNPAGDTVASVFGPAFFDPAGLAVGIAVTAVSGTSDGAWQYSTDGGANWTNVPTVSMSHALLLAASVKLRFVPSKSFSGVVTLTAFAWDGSGASANLTTSGTGGSSPVSATPLIASCFVNTALGSATANGRPQIRPKRRRKPLVSSLAAFGRSWCSSRFNSQREVSLPGQFRFWQRRRKKTGGRLLHAPG